MTPRSRKPVMIVSTSNLCNLVTGNNDCKEHNLAGPNNVLREFDLNTLGVINCASILEESQTYSNSTDNALQPYATDVRIQDAGNDRLDIHEGHDCINISAAKYFTTTQESSTSITSTFRELSRSVLTASPVDLNFMSRTGDFEQSESDLNILNNDDTLSDSLLHCLDGNQLDTFDTSGIAFGSTNSANNSTETIAEESSSPRKRGTNLQ